MRRKDGDKKSARLGENPGSYLMVALTLRNSLTLPSLSFPTWNMRVKMHTSQERPKDSRAYPSVSLM